VHPEPSGGDVQEEVSADRSFVEESWSSMNNSKYKKKRQKSMRDIYAPAQK
jgi:hypothetical protein